jgi:hypothetical protein
MSNIISGLYLLCEREFIKTNETIYKIGRSNDISKRINQYPNGSIVYLIIWCKDNLIHEHNLIKIFNIKFTNKKYIGTEYFYGNINLMKTIMIDYMKNINNNFNIIDNEIIIERFHKDNNTHIPKYEQNINKKIITIKNIIVETKSIIKQVKKTELVETIAIIEPNKKIITKEQVDIKIKKFNKIFNKICNCCKKEFQYPYLLIKHQNTIIKCLPKLNPILSNPEIEKKEKKQIEIHLCKTCNKTFSTNGNLVRHTKLCKKKVIANKVIVNKVIKNEIISNNPNKIIIDCVKEFRIYAESVNKNMMIQLLNFVKSSNDKIIDIKYINK